MTPDEAIRIVDSKAQGRTRYEDRHDFLDEILVAEINRLREKATELPDFNNMTPKQVREWGNIISRRSSEFGLIHATILTECRPGRSLDDFGIKYDESKSVLYNLIYILETLINKISSKEH